MSSSSPISLGRVVAIAAGLALALGLWHYSGGDAGTSHADDQGAERAGARALVPHRSSAPRPAMKAPARAAGSVAEDMGIDVESLPQDEPLAVYLRNSVYAPTSRPLSAANVDLIEWNRRYESEKVGANDPEVSYMFTSDKYHVIGDESLTVTLQVWRAGAVLPVTINAAYVAPFGATGAAPTMAESIPMSLLPAGSMYTQTLALADHESLTAAGRPLALGLYVEFEYEGGTQRANFRVAYTPEAQIPARFTGRFEEAVEDGSLVVYAGAFVETAGHYVIDANLYGADDAPVAWTRFKGRLEAGESRVRLVFMGRVLIEGAASGPYRLGELRGVRYAPGQWPDTEHMTPYLEPYMTSAYDPSQFSDAEWDSPHKRATIRRLLQDAESGAGPHVFTATPGQ